MTTLPNGRWPCVLAGCAVCARVATRGEAFTSHPPTPPRSLLAALRSSACASPPRPQRRPARCCIAPPPAHTRTHVLTSQWPHITPPAPLSSEWRRSTTASRPPPLSRLDPAVDRACVSCSDADGVTCSASISPLTVHSCLNPHPRESVRALPLPPPSASWPQPSAIEFRDAGLNRARNLRCLVASLP